jgi:hypothetical protein
MINKKREELRELEKNIDLLEKSKQQLLTKQKYLSQREAAKKIGFVQQNST